ncbi:MAG: hypothetical protein H7Y38_20705 [Armatimonadetes bacterium]|nr:hypothetical protein [Armatimonadota bacterium]
MSTAFPAVSFEEAVREFVLHLEATRAAKSVYHYRVQLSMLARRAEDNEVRFGGFGKRH